jgi:outer membrane protein
MTRSHFVAGLAAIILAAALPAAAQISVAVIDVQRVVTESDPGKQALQKLKGLQDGKIDEGRALQQELTTMQEQLSKQRFTLSEEKLAELGKQIEDKQIALQRFQDDAERELEEARRRELGGLEARIIPVIDAVGAERGFTLIFNKFQSGLVYADDSVDITDEVIRRFNTTQ